jgi:hypothetical protein
VAPLGAVIEWLNRPPKLDPYRSRVSGDRGQTRVSAGLEARDLPLTGAHPLRQLGLAQAGAPTPFG